MYREPLTGANGRRSAVLAMMRLLLAVLLLLLPWGAAQPQRPALRLTSAGQVPAGNLVLAGESVGVVVERGEAPADAKDQTPTVRVLILQAPETAPRKRGEVQALGGLELVADLGALDVQITPPTVRPPPGAAQPGG